MNSNEQFLDEYSDEYREGIELTTAQPEDSSADKGVSTLAAGVAGAAVGAVIGSKVAGKTGAVIGLVLLQVQ